MKKLLKFYFMAKKTRIVSIIIILLVVFAGAIFWVRNYRKADAPVKIEEEAKQEGNEQQKQKIDTSNWKTYRNEEFGFEMKYPEDWIIDTKRSNKNKIVFSPIKGIPGSIEAINFEKNTGKLTLEQIIKKKKESFNDVIKKEEFLMINGERACRIETTEFGISRILFIHGDYKYEIESMGHLEKKEVLDSFVFISERLVL